MNRAQDPPPSSQRGSAAAADSPTSADARRAHTLFRLDKTQLYSTDTAAVEHDAWHISVPADRTPDRSVRIAVAVLSRGHDDTNNLRHWGNTRSGKRTGTRAYAADCIRGDTRI